MQSFFDGVTGNPQDAFTPELSVIPNNTQARAMIKQINVVETENKYSGKQKFIEIIWKLIDSDFKNQEVKQKIKCFHGEPAAIQRAKNMLMLLLNLCNHKLTHENEPTVFDLLPISGKVLAIKIREWAIQKDDGGMMEGNFVCELHSADSKDFVTETGIKLVAKPASRGYQSGGQQLDVPNIADQDVPF